MPKTKRDPDVAIFAENSAHTILLRVAPLIAKLTWSITYCFFLIAEFYKTKRDPAVAIFAEKSAHSISTQGILAVSLLSFNFLRDIAQFDPSAKSDTKKRSWSRDHC